MALRYVDRRGTDSVKWDCLEERFGREDLTAMWVADMDFEPAPCIKKALREYVDNVPFGYYHTPESYYDAVMNWEKTYLGCDVSRESICFSPGVVSAFYWISLMLTKPGDSIMVFTPVYYPMLNAVKHNDRNLVMCDLDHNGSTYSADLERFEKDIEDNDVKLLIFCNPHNPVGKVWTAEEIKAIMDICEKHGVYVISDEIHADFVYEGYKHVPVCTVGDYDKFLITLRAASKTFNIAACQNSTVIIPDEELRARYKDFTKRIAVDGGNSFGYIATEAALREGRPWFEEVKEQIYSNYKLVKERFAEELPKIGVAELQGTYLLWLDFSAYFETQAEMEDFLINSCRLAFDYGSWFGGLRFAPFARMNLATNRENMLKAINTIIAEIKRLENVAELSKIEKQGEKEEKNE